MDKEILIKSLEQAAKINEEINKTYQEKEKIDDQIYKIENKITYLNQQIKEVNILSKFFDGEKIKVEIEKTQDKILVLKDELWTVKYQVRRNLLQIIDKLKNEKDKLYRKYGYESDYRIKFGQFDYKNIIKHIKSVFNKNMIDFYYKTSDTDRYDEYLEVHMIATQKIYDILKTNERVYSLDELKKLQRKLNKNNKNVMLSDIIFIKEDLLFSNLFNMNAEQLEQNNDLIEFLYNVYNYIVKNDKASLEKSSNKVKKYNDSVIKL